MNSKFFSGIKENNFFFVNFVEDGELRRVLQSLACGKARVLSKNPKVKIAQHSLPPMVYKYVCQNVESGRNLYEAK